ncbi:pseudouridine synthase family protein [Megalodesulfovibrio paquesii]
MTSAPHIQPVWTIPPALDQMRLDLALAALTGLGRRGTHRLLERHRVLLDGRTAHKGQLVRAGQRLELCPELTADSPAGPQPLAVAIVTRTADYAALAKPSGLHTAALAGAAEADSLERRLPALFPDETPQLCNRLDRETSGLVLAAFSSAAREAYRAFEDAGQVDKRYLAVVHGTVPGPLRLDKALDVSRRAKTRVENFSAADPLRVTSVTPLRVLASGKTLVDCRIRKGARHQIRAHLAAAGHPILGDTLYGHGEAGRLLLHHACLVFPGFSAALDAEFNTV